MLEDHIREPWELLPFASVSITARPMKTSAQSTCCLQQMAKIRKNNEREKAAKKNGMRNAQEEWHTNHLQGQLGEKKKTKCEWTGWKSQSVDKIVTQLWYSTAIILSFLYSPPKELHSGDLAIEYPIVHRSQPILRVKGKRILNQSWRVNNLLGCCLYKWSPTNWRLNQINQPPNECVGVV